MSETIMGAGIALAGVTLGLLIDLLRDTRKATARKASRRFDVEYESMHELSDLLPTFTGQHEADLEARKVRAVALAWRVRDERASRAVELLVVQPVGSQEWNDQMGNAIRDIGRVMRDL